MSSFHYDYPRNFPRLREERTTRVSSFHYDYRKYFALACCRGENKSKTKVARFRRKNFSGTDASMKVYANGISLEHTYVRALSQNPVFFSGTDLFTRRSAEISCAERLLRNSIPIEVYGLRETCNDICDGEGLKREDIVETGHASFAGRIAFFSNDPSTRIDRSKSVKTCLRRQIMDSIRKPWRIIGDGTFSSGQSVFTHVYIRENFIFQIYFSTVKYIR